QARAMGARRLERLARQALMAAGHAIAPPPISETLTPPERRVCELAALGLDDREIAQALFVSVSEVRGHLRTALEKLGVDDRSGLHSALRAA
ncbi:MAG TPA: LuxR C-terminal-related transcriptional regulator, partial [Solirubrobacteraceae bacterium]|nr:LuxR C-terminal-related transcriptional regulator [Solirubrobacteraceae bacterium]